MVLLGFLYTNILLFKKGNKKMKIAMLAGNGGSGGLIAYIKGLISANVVPKDSEVVLFCGGNLATKLVDVADRISIHSTPFVNERGLEVVTNKYLNNSLIELIDKFNPDLVFFLNGYIRKGLEHYPNIMVLHNQLYIDNKQLWRQGFSYLTLTLFAFRYHVRKSMKNSDGVIFLSEASMKQAIDKKIYFKKGTVTYFGIEEENRIEQVIQKPLNTPINMIYISAIYPYKNHIELVRGLNLIKKDNIPFKLHLVGAADPKTKNKLDKLIKKYDMVSSVIYHNWVEHEKINEMIDAADIFLYPSSIETTGFGLMEGMARGAAIASSNQSCFPGILNDGGIYFNPKDRISIYKALKALISDDNLRILHSKRALDISRLYTWDKLAKETYDFLNCILNKR